MKNVTNTVTINAPVEHVYQSYTSYNTLDDKMNELENIELKGNEFNKMSWNVEAVGGMNLKWDARVIRQVPNQLIEWDEIDDSTIKTKGQVTFSKLTEESTQVTVDCNYTVPGGDWVASIGELFANPQELLKSNLEAFKKSCEADVARGEVKAGRTNMTEPTAIHSKSVGV